MWIITRGLLFLWKYTHIFWLQVQQIYSENLPHIINQKDLVDIDEHVSGIKDNIKWMAETYQPMREWFEKQTRGENTL